MKIFFLWFMCFFLCIVGSVNAHAQMRIAHEQPVIHNVNLSLLYLKQRIELDTQGRVRLDVIAEGDGGQAVSLLEQVQAGLLPMAVIGTRKLKDILPAFSLLDLPFVFPDRKSLYSFIDGPFRKKFDQILQDRNLFALAWLDIGPRKWLSATKPFSKPLDFRESKMNIPDDFVSYEIIKALGATATTVPIQVSEVPGLLERGSLDVADVLLDSNLLSSDKKFQAYLTNSNHVWETAVLVTSISFWKNMTMVDQDLFREAARDMEIVNRGWAVRDDTELQITAKARGMDLIALETEERRAFLKVLSPVHQSVKTMVGQDLFDQFMSSIRDNRSVY